MSKDIIRLVNIVSDLIRTNEILNNRLKRVDKDLNLMAAGLKASATVTLELNERVKDLEQLTSAAQLKGMKVYGPIKH